MTIDEMLKIAQRAKEDGFGDMDFNEYLREYDEYIQDKREEAFEEQCMYDSIAEAHGSRWDNW